MPAATSSRANWDGGAHAYSPSLFAKHGKGSCLSGVGVGVGAGAGGAGLASCGGTVPRGLFKGCQACCLFVGPRSPSSVSLSTVGCSRRLVRGDHSGRAALAPGLSGCRQKGCSWDRRAIFRLFSSLLAAASLLCAAISSWLVSLNAFSLTARILWSVVRKSSAQNGGEFSHVLKDVLAVCAHPFPLLRHGVSLENGFLTSAETMIRGEREGGRKVYKESKGTGEIELFKPVEKDVCATDPSPRPTRAGLHRETRGPNTVSAHEARRVAETGRASHHQVLT